MKGKIPITNLAEFTGYYYGTRRPEVVLGASALGDSAVVDTNAPLVVSTDPITGAEDYVGELSVYVNANDVRVGGGEPVAYLATILMPESYPLDDVREMFVGLDQGLKFEGAQLVGGHTEFTSSVNWPVVVGTMLGRRVRELNKELMSEGQEVVLAGELGLEGKMIITKTYAQNIKRISIKPIMEIALGEPSLVFAHDLTEGGLVSGIWELIRGTGLSIQANLPVEALDPELWELSARMGFNPYKLVSSGAVLLVCTRGERLVSLLRSRGIRAQVLGVFQNGGEPTLNGEKLADMDPEGPDALWLL